MKHTKLSKLLKDRIYAVVICTAVVILSTMLCVAFKAPTELTIALAVIEGSSYIVLILIEYYRKKHYYNELLDNINELDKKYLIAETVNRPDFYEGEILYNVISEAGRSMAENVKQYRMGMEDFKEYVEMWIHEIKLPTASLTLMLHNNSTPDSSKITTQLSRINNYIEQILYYVRSENAEKDYIINECRLSKVINAVAVKNKDYLLDNHIDLIVTNVNVTIMTDSKWLEFIFNQIISNSIKYCDNEKNEKVIKISAAEDKNSITVSIYDNGIGICEADVSRVFDKSFTGENGRKYSKATGMGLYIAKKLCDKLGHKIVIESKEGEYTQLDITFYKNDFYKELV